MLRALCLDVSLGLEENSGQPRVAGLTWAKATWMEALLSHEVNRPLQLTQQRGAFSCSSLDRCWGPPANAL